MAKAYGATVGKLSANSIGTLPFLLDPLSSPFANHPSYLLDQVNAGQSKLFAGQSKLFATIAGHQKAGDCSEQQRCLPHGRANIMATVNPSWGVPSVTSSTNLGPLTTSISFPANCFTNLYDFQTYGLGAPYTYETQGCALSTCCPYDKFYTNGWGWFSSYYSPAVCPSEYKSCAPYTALVKEPDETAIFCCPQ